MTPADARHWSEYVRQMETSGVAYVVTTVLGARGSTPRDSGTKMVLSADSCYGTIGGGRLEYEVQMRARELLANNQDAQLLENFPLGEKLGQCCGGSTSVLLECFTPACLPTYLFGAGHVGRALAPLLAVLPLALTWVDSRSDEFPNELPTGVSQRVTETPQDVVGVAAPGSAFIIMTHQHPLDYALTEAALRRGDASYIGLIGSQSKWKRFQMRLEHRGVAATDHAQVRCPIGLASVPGKHPAEIAVSVAAELIAHYHSYHRAARANSSVGWKRLRDQLRESGAIDSLTAGSES